MMLESKLLCLSIFEVLGYLLVCRHFTTLRATDTYPQGISKTVCLAVTRKSVQSFSQIDKSLPGFVHAVDPTFVLAESAEEKVHFCW
jgi:hypothetical protein